LPHRLIVAAYAAGRGARDHAVGELTPVRRRRFVSADEVVAAFTRAAPLDAARFREDVDRFVGQDPAPRG
jgi:hypothetical protein